MFKRGFPLYSFRLVLRTGEEVVYAETRRSSALSALLMGVMTLVSALLFLHVGFLNRYPWLILGLTGFGKAESWGERVLSSIVIAWFLAWALQVVFFAAILIRCLVPRELRIRLRDGSVVLRKAPFFWRATERTFREGEVDAVELSIEGRRYHQEYRLRLRLKTGRAVKLHDGRLSAEISQMASEIAVAVDARQARS